MGNSASIRQQIHNNLVAIISLTVAVSSLLYAAWRHEVTEAQRNFRQAGFEILRNLGKLQPIADHAHYDGDSLQGNPVSGWGRALAIRDLSRFLPTGAQEHAKILRNTWGAGWHGLGNSQPSSDRVSAAISKFREGTIQLLVELD